VHLAGLLVEPLGPHFHRKYIDDTAFQDGTHHFSLGRVLAEVCRP
jgi:hypothetical protein